MPESAYAAAHDSAAFFDLSDRGLTEVSGKDAVSFLNNLTTNDIKNLAVGSACEAFLTTNKARVVAHFFVNRLRRDDGEVFWLDADPGLAEKLLRQLDRYLISEQVVLADRSTEFSHTHLCGPRARDVVSGCTAAPLMTVPRDELALPGFAIFWPRAQTADLRHILQSVGATPGDLATYEILRVEAGLPVCGPDIDDNRLVMEVGRTRQAICYTKGCFLGQEPIVMARDRGHINRSLLGLRIKDGPPVPGGAAVCQAKDEVGQVTSSVVSPRLGTIALAYLQRSAHAPGTRVEVAVRGGRQPAEVAPLPFPAAQSA
jgi:folate-binding protein YgfZ